MSEAGARLTQLRFLHPRKTRTRETWVLHSLVVLSVPSVPAAAGRGEGAFRAGRARGPRGVCGTTGTSRAPLSWQTGSLASPGRPVPVQTVGTAERGRAWPQPALAGEQMPAEPRSRPAAGRANPPRQLLSSAPVPGDGPALSPSPPSHRASLSVTALSSRSPGAAGGALSWLPSAAAAGLWASSLAPRPGQPGELSRNLVPPRLTPNTSGGRDTSWSWRRNRVSSAMGVGKVCNCCFY